MAQGLPTESDQTSRQLHGWKDIASHFGRSVRTVQRWERDFGLPVRRLGLGRSEIVHAFVHELEQWRTTAEARAADDTSPSSTDDAEQVTEGSGAFTVDGTAASSSTTATPSLLQGSAVRRSAWPSRLLLLMGVVLLGATVGWMAWGPRPTPLAGDGEPAGFRTDDTSLTALDSAGRTLWTHTFPFRLVVGQWDTLPPSQGASRVAIDDINRDGQQEVLFVSKPADARKRDWRLYCFGALGRLLWVVDRVEGQTFGGQRYEPPFAADRFVLDVDASGQRTIWAIFVHSPWFPSVLYGLDAKGTVHSEYWSNGYIETVKTARWGTRRVVVVGARNNESGGASIALFENTDPSGSAPAASSRYRCDTCPPGHPTRFVQLPKPARLAALGGTSRVERIEADNPDGILVWIGHGFDGGHNDAVAIYTLDANLRPLSVGVYDRFHLACEALARQGKIPPCPSTDPVDELRTIRWWDGTQFVNATAPKAGESVRRSTESSSARGR